MPDGIRRLISRCRGRDPDSSARYSALNAAFIIESGLVQRWREQSFDPWFGVKGWQPARHRAYHLFDYNQMGHDWRAITKEIHGHEMRNPLADRRLLEFALTVPEQMYRRDGIPRSFARDVLADRLPREILDDPKRGTNGVTWFRRLNSRRQEVIDELDNIEASPLGRRLLDVARLKRIADQWPADENAAELRGQEFKVVLSRGVHIGRFIRWVEGENA
jgi:asparagine synthase (glutamine-hydrolysing)